jgi:hypothetical protein
MKILVFVRQSYLVTGCQKTNPPKYYSMKASVKEISPLLSDFSPEFLPKWSGYLYLLIRNGNIHSAEYF